MRIGKPFYAWETVEEICSRLIAGRSLMDVCRDPDMPARRTVYDWLAAHPEFASRYAQACLLRLDAHLDEDIELERQALEGELDPRILQVVAGNRRWRAERLNPRKYGPNRKTGAEAEAEAAADLERRILEGRRRAAGPFAPAAPAPAKGGKHE